MFKSNPTLGDNLAICDICGFMFYMSQTRKTWEGLRVCEKDWDPKHPQLTIRGLPDRQAVYDGRPEPKDVFITSYGLGAFCLISPNGTIYIVSIDDDGAVLVTPGTLGEPLIFVHLGNYLYSVADDGAIIPISALSTGPMFLRMRSPNNNAYQITGDVDGAWIVDDITW